MRREAELCAVLSHEPYLPGQAVPRGAKRLSWMLLRLTEALHCGPCRAAQQSRASNPLTQHNELPRPSDRWAWRASSLLLLRRLCCKIDGAIVQASVLVSCLDNLLLVFYRHLAGVPHDRLGNAQVSAQAGQPVLLPVLLPGLPVA